VAHPVIAAGIAMVLVTGVEPLVLASMPWEALSPQNDALRLTWHPPDRTLIGASQVTTRTPATTAVFYVPASVRPLLHAARHFSRSSPGHRPAGRLFAATRFSNAQIAAAAANCKIVLPSQRSLQRMWQTKVTCIRADSFGTRFDASFAEDQGFDPGPRSAEQAAEREILQGVSGRLTEVLVARGRPMFFLPGLTSALTSR
jgi:hypothetical protein